jgi:CheY-like chemotaxis protein
MEGARVVVIEDREPMRRVVARNLHHYGHSVVGEAATFQEALDIVDRIASGELEADVIVLDGNLSPDLNDGREARMIYDRLKQQSVLAKIIGFSMMPMKTYGIAVDADSQKEPDRLIEAIESF